MTVREAAPDTPAVLAKMLVVPSLSPVASPEPSTVATAGRDEDEMEVWAAMALPLASRADAVNCRVIPMEMVSASGETVT